MFKITSNTINKKIYEEYTKYLLFKFYYYNKYNKIINNNVFFNYITFYPLPTKLITKYCDNIIENQNIYSFSYFNNNSKSILLFADRILPYHNNSPIPFCFPIININNDIELIDSNIYYYELSILENYKDSNYNDNISIGFGTINTPLGVCPGWYNNTFGLNLISGVFYYNQILNIKIIDTIKEGDTIGAGIIYTEKNKFKPFFTLNGVLLKDLDEIFIKSEIVPIISYNYSNKIKLNFSQEKFVFNIKSMINNNVIISQSNVFINSNYSLNKIDMDTIVLNKNNNFTNISSNTTFINIPLINNEIPQISNLLLSLID